MKQSNSIISKKIVNSLNPEIKDIFDAIDESQREIIYSIHNDNKNDNNDNDKFFEIHGKDKKEEKTNIIDIEINDMSLLTRDVQIEMIKKEKTNMFEKQINDMSLSINDIQIKNKQDPNEDQENEKNSLSMNNKKRGFSDSFIKITDKNMEDDKLSLR